MKAQKLIINWEEQNLSQVFSVNWQTGDVTVNSTPWVTYIVYDYGNNCYAVDEWDFKDGDLVRIDVESADEPTSSINIDGNVIDMYGYDKNNWWNWSS